VTACVVDMILGTWSMMDAVLLVTVGVEEMDKDG